MQQRGAGPIGVVLGTMNLGGRTPPEEARRILARAVERGVTRIDSANVYVEGASEVLVGELARAHPGRLEIATKVGIGTLKGPAEGLDPKVIDAAIEASLRRLGVDRVALYYLHKPDPKTPIEATLAALAPHLAAGRIDAWALSNFSAWRTLEAIHIAEAAGMARPRVGQMLYNVLVRDLEHEYLAFARAYALHTTVFNPLAGGLLAGQHARGAPPAGSRFEGNPVYQRRYWSDRLLDVIDDLTEVAQTAGLSMVELSYRWLAGQSAVDSIVIGPRTVAHLDAALDAIAQGPLSREVSRAVDGIYQAYRGTDARYAR